MLRTAFRQNPPRLLAGPLLIWIECVGAAAAAAHSGEQLLYPDYQYDAFNRLIQVNEIGTAVIDPGSARVASGAVGDLVCRYVYDRLGRLIVKENPINEGATYLQRKEYYYDGVRRIQEVITRPAEQPEVLPDGAFVMGGEAANDELVLKRTDGSDPGQQLLEGGGRPPPEPQEEVWTDREYVYGPGYVDEFICQIDRYANAIYMLQDANYNVVALLDAYGALLEQYAYEPYGAVIVAETFADRAVNRVGHQGLFFERLDGDYTQRTVSPTDNGLYYNRNRWYSPHLGRFMQRDPNDTGMPILAALAMNGDSLDVLLGGFNLTALYADGMNLYQYEGNNPVSGRDPMGLSLLLGELEGRTWESVLYTNVALAGAGAAGVLLGNLMYGMDLRYAAYDAIYAGVQMFSMGLAGEAMWALGERYLAYAARVATSRAAGQAFTAARAGFKTGAEAEAWLARMFPGRSQVSANTSHGRRVIDQVSGAKAYEAKVGYQKWSSAILEQIRKDLEVLRGRSDLKGIRGYEWHFFRSANTGKVGADPRVLSELRKAEILPVIHE